MKYIYFEFEEIKYWMEIDTDGYALRQIVINYNGSVSISCRDDCLAEKMIDLDDTCQIIDSVEFESMWHKHCEKYRYQWEISKIHFFIGSLVEGFVSYFYPQGIIFYIGDIQGVANYEECQRNSLPKNMYPGHKITGIVSGYDDTNMWIIISDSKVLDL